MRCTLIYARIPSLSLPPSSGTCKAFEYLHPHVHVLEICNPKVVCERKWLLAYNYIHNYKIYIYEREPFKKSRLDITWKIHKIFIFIPKILGPSPHVSHLDSVMCSCKLSWIFKHLSYIQYVGILEMSTLGTLTEFGTCFFKSKPCRQWSYTNHNDMKHLLPQSGTEITTTTTYDWHKVFDGTCYVGCLHVTCALTQCWLAVNKATVVLDLLRQLHRVHDDACLMLVGNVASFRFNLYH